PSRSGGDLVADCRQRRPRTRLRHHCRPAPVARPADGRAHRSRWSTRRAESDASTMIARNPRHFRSTERRYPAVRNERGVALLVVLMIVALLTITVTEFTYSVQIDAHRTRNALHALQAQLWARAGFKLAGGFLMLDDEPS